MPLEWLPGRDSHPRPLRYERSVLLLNYPAILEAGTGFEPVMQGYEPCDLDQTSRSRSVVDPSIPYRI